MLHIVIASLFALSFAVQPYVAITKGHFNFPFVVDENVVSEGGLSQLYLSTSHRCASSIVIGGDFAEGSSILVERVSGIDQNDIYEYTTVGEGTVAKGSTTVEFATPVCGSSWRFTSLTPSTAAPWNDLTIMAEAPIKSAKRAVSCDTPGIYPPECSAASEGALCLDSSLCGCKDNRDCFSNTDYPYCDTTLGVCERCTFANTNNGNDDHFFCRTRYPGYATQPTSGEPLAQERVAPVNFYREVCLRSPPESSGACQRCNQAPLRAYGFPTQASNEGASGTFHCNSIRPNMPICMDKTYFDDCGIPGAYNVSLRGSCVPCTFNSQCARALPNTPHCDIATGTCGVCKANTDCSGTGRANCQADGTCLSCTSNANCGGNDGGETPNSPVCNVNTGICGACETNAQCAGTSGANCQANGACQTCKADSDCGATDGGEQPGQTLCNVNTGICESACVDNIDCADKPGKNCMATGRCVSCTVDADCGDKDGGRNPGQVQCDVPTGLCVTPFHCTNNSMCENQGGNNCQKDGSCVSCTGTATCGPLDLGDQPNCNMETYECVDRCNTNAECENTQGANCQADGICHSCTSNADCGDKDGGEKPGELTCNVTSGICGPCGANSDCPPERANCGDDGLCYNCSTPGSSCETDGPPGHTPNPHCDALTGVCVDGCTLDEHCTDECFPRCNLDTFCCVECISNDHCPLATWRGDAVAKTTCAADTHTCRVGCASDADCTTPSRPACGENGKCVECSVDAHCGGDRPACDTGAGVCVECVTDKNCVRLGLAACSPSSQKCVGCLNDLHCGNNLKCEVGSQRCFQCIFDFHCETNHYCGDDLNCVRGSRGNLSIGAIVGIAIAAFILLVVGVAVIVVARKQSKMSAPEAQRLV